MSTRWSSVYNGSQTLGWGLANTLTSIGGAGINESYLYDAAGQRVKKTSSVETVYYVNPLYEVRNGVITKYFVFNGVRIALRQGTNPLLYLHGDQLGSTVMTSQGNTTVTQRYCAYGRKRTVSNDNTICGSGNSLATDYTFTGQKLDGTGLQYFNARYYDPELGTFISPDRVVPDPTNLFDYNRYMFVRGNPMRYTDPTGHYSEDEIKQYLQDTYGDAGKDYWSAWQADPYWMWVLATAQDGYILFSSQGGNVSFGHKDGSFVLSDGKNLHDLQGKGAYKLLDDGQQLVEDNYWLGYGSNYGMYTSALFRSGMYNYYQPIYNYASGTPQFSHWQLIHALPGSAEINVGVGDAVPALATLLEYLPGQVGELAAKGLGVVGWLTVANDVMRLTVDKVTYTQVAQWPPYSSYSNENGQMTPIPNQWLWENPNGVQYPAPTK